MAVQLRERDLAGELADHGRRIPPGAPRDRRARLTGRAAGTWGPRGEASWTVRPPFEVNRIWSGPTRRMVPSAALIESPWSLSTTPIGSHQLPPRSTPLHRPQWPSANGCGPAGSGGVVVGGRLTPKTSWRTASRTPPFDLHVEADRRAARLDGDVALGTGVQRRRAALGRRAPERADLDVADRRVRGGQERGHVVADATAVDLAEAVAAGRDAVEGGAAGARRGRGLGGHARLGGDAGTGAGDRRRRVRCRRPWHRPPAGGAGREQRPRARPAVDMVRSGRFMAPRRRDACRGFRRGTACTKDLGKERARRSEIAGL